MKHTTIWLLAAAVTAALEPSALVSQKTTSAGLSLADEILKNIAIADGEFGNSAAAPATYFLGQWDPPGNGPGRYGPRPQHELDAFADRLVNIALANPESEVAEEIAGVFLRSTMGDDHQTPYSGAFDALERLHHGGAGSGTMWLYLVGADPRRGIELGIREWENGHAGLTTRAEGCQFVREVSRYGSLAVKDGKLVFEPREGVGLDPGSRGHTVERTWEVGAPAQHWSFGEELRQAGFLKTDIDHPCRAVL